MEILTSVASKIVKNLVATLGRQQIGYLIFYKNNVEGLNEHVSKLLEARESVQVVVEEAIRHGEEIMKDVQIWLRSVDETIAKAENFFEDARHAKTKFYNSPFFRYNLSRRAKKMTYYASELLAKGKFDRVSYRPHLSIYSVPTSDFEEFESRKPILEGIMEAIKDPNIHVVGVRGMPGVGKTTLVKQFALRVYQDHLFDQVVMVVVSHNPDVRKIQAQVADWLGLRLEQEGVRARASRLYMRLKQERRVLIILDDVWSRLDLVQIGIPKGVEIIVNSRDQNVLLQMDAQKIFCIEPLLQNEAVSWFLKVAGITDDIESQSDHRYREFGIGIVNKCTGLPLLLVAVANGLRNKGFQAWEDASWQLERSVEDGYRSVFSSIEMSYLFLEYELQQLMFLLCAALGEEIFLEHLLKLCLGLGLFKDTVTVEEARWRMFSVIHSLKAKSLLQDSKTSSGATMNNAIRHVALQIASKAHNMFVVPDGFQDSKWPYDEDLIQNFTAIFLLGNHRGELPERLACPKLELLHVYDESGTLTIPDNFFVRINKGLKVLSLINMKLPCLPPSICGLTKIQTLCLDKCDLEDITLLGILKNLEVLSLSGSSIEQLPREIGNLAYLCLLDLSNCSKLETIPPNVLSNLIRLQELLLPNCYGHWQYSEGSNVERTNATLDELCHLNNLEALDIHIPDVKVVPRNFPSHKLEKYNISIGQVQGQCSGKFERNLQLNLSSADIHVYDLVKPLMGKSEELWLKELKGFKSTHEFDPKGFPKLKHLHIQDMAEMEYIVNCEYLNPFPMLELLVLNNLLQLKGLYKCSNLGAVVGGKKEDQVSGVQADDVIEFPELRALTLQNLPKFIGFMSKEDTEEAGLNSSILFDEKVVFPNLEKLNLHRLGQLTVICKDHGLSLQRLTSLALFECDNLMYLFSSPAAEALTHLQELRITACKSIEEIVVAESGTATNNKIVLPKVNTLIFENLAKLHSFCRDGCNVEWPSLKKVRVSKCSKIKQFALGIVHKYDFEVEVKECSWHKERYPWRSIKYLFVLSVPLRTQTILDIESTENLKIQERQLPDSFYSKLRKLSARNCDETLSDFLFKLLRCSHELEHLEVKQCDLLRQIFNFEKLVANESGNGKYLALLKTIRLRDLPTLKCIWNKDPTGILGLHNLEEMEIVNCGFLKAIISTSLAQHLRQLKELKIHSCPTVEVVAMNSEEDTGTKEILLPELQNLELVLLPKFERLHAKNCPFQFPSIQSLTIEDCPTMDAFTSGFLSATPPVSNVNPKKLLQGVTAAYPKLKILKLQGLHNIEDIWQGSFSSGSFSELKEVEVYTFGKLKYVISSNMLPMLKDLEKLTVKNCDSLFEVFQLNEGFEFVSSMFPKPSTLVLISLPKLQHIIESGGSRIFENLQTLKVERCDSLQSLVFPSSCLQKLRKLQISECKVLEEIMITGGEKIEEKFLFTSLESIVLEKLPKLSTFCPKAETFEFPSVREISIINCPKLMTFPSRFSLKENFSATTDHFFGNQVVFPNLEKLNLHGLHQLRIIYNDHGLSLQMLNSLALSECNNLKYLFSSQAAKALSHLQELKITACKLIEEIVVAESGTDTNKIALPKVKTLILENLAKLHSFCWDGCIVEWQSLKKVRVVKCPKIMQYALGIVDKSNLEVEVKECPWHQEDDPESSTKYLFVLSDQFENQAILDIKTSEELRRLEMELRPLSFSKLMKLSASNCNETLSDFLSRLIRRSHELQHLEVKQCESLIQVFNLQKLVANEIGNGKYFALLKTIKLWDLPNLSCIWNKDPTGILDLHNLEEMEIVNCGLLEMRSIFSTSLAEHLRQLKVLKIHSCPTVEVVLMNPEDETGTREIGLPELHTLELVLLPKFKRLHAGNYLFQFPSMQSLIIEDCPTMDAFTSGFLNAQTLPAIEGKSKEGPQGEKAAYTKMKNLKLKGLQNIEEIWQGSISHRSFSELKEVVVNAFGKLKHVIPSNMLPMLKDLETLSVENCDSITEVFQITDKFEFNSTMFPKPSTVVLISLPKLLHIIKIEYGGSRIFENLQTLIVKRCNSLRSLVFPSSCLHTLKKLEISECVVLEEIIVMQGEGDIEEKMLFTCLESFVLEKLPKLSTFCQEAFEFSSVVEISIISCPKLKTFPAGFSTKENLSTATNHFFTNQGSFEKLQKLHLANLDRLDFCLKVWNETMSPKSLCELQDLELGQSSELLNIIPSCLLNRMQKLKKCTVRECKALELAFDIDKDNYQNEELLPRLEELVLTDLPHMVLWRQEPRIPVFKNLKFLEFVRCSSLKKLFSISMAKNLEQLELLKLYECEKLEHVLGEGEAGSIEDVEFKKLKHLILKYLPSLICFCKEDCKIKWPELDMVRVKNIPKMTTFAKGTQETPKLKEFYITYVSNCWQGDLNKTIEHLCNNPGADSAGHMIVENTLTSSAPTNKTVSELESAEPSI